MNLVHLHAFCFKLVHHKNQYYSWINSYFDLYQSNVYVVKEWEMLVLQILKWELCAVIPHDYLHPFVSRLNVDQAHASQIIRHAQTFIALCATG